jgi:aryl-alcohol dehydrogenase-like predicted oxidoreductase
MSFGTAENWVHNPWALNEEDSRKIIKRALDLGVNFFDTANAYAYGSSERILGKAINDFANRDEVVVATKVFVPMSQAPNGGGLSRKHILSQVDHSLERLGMDYIDLYIIHRWDYHTPIEETMEALHDIVKAGKVRYIGASAMYAWQFQKALHVAGEHGWTRFVSMQNHYNLIYREEEREMMPLCEEEKIAVTPYSPLASGRLARAASETTTRYEADPIAKTKYGATAESDQLIIDRVAEVSEKYSVPMAHVSLAWMLHKNPVVAPVIGAIKIRHLESAVAAVDVKLELDDIAYLEEPYVPHPVVGLIPYGGQLLSARK